MSNFAQRLKRKFKNQAVAVLCARYCYRGILKDVDRDFITLAYPRAVEVTGPASSTSPTSEDILAGEIEISLAAVEMVSQPLWVWHEMPNTKEVQKGKKIVSDAVQIIKLKEELSKEKGFRERTQKQFEETCIYWKDRCAKLEETIGQQAEKKVDSVQQTPDTLIGTPGVNCHHTMQSWYIEKDGTRGCTDCDDQKKFDKQVAAAVKRNSKAKATARAKTKAQQKFRI